MKILSNLDLHLNQILNARLEVVTTLPEGVAGQVVFHGEENKFYGFNGTQWVDLSKLPEEEFTPELKAALEKVISDLEVEIARAKAAEAELTEEVAKKADASDVYTKTEVDTKINGTKIFAADLIANEKDDSVEGSLANRIKATEADITSVETDINNLTEVVSGKADADHTHTVEEVSGLGELATMNKNEVALIGEDGKVSTSVLPSIAINNTFVVADVDAAMAKEVEVGDIVIINPDATPTKETTITGTFIVVDLEATDFEGKFRPLQSISDSVSKAELEKALAAKADKTQVASDIADAKTFATAEAKKEAGIVDARLEAAKESLETSIAAVDSKVDGVASDLSDAIDSINSAINDVVSSVEEHTSNTEVHITNAERVKWNAAANKVTKFVGTITAETDASVELTHGLEGFVQVSVYDKDGNQVIISNKLDREAKKVTFLFGQVTDNEEFDVVVLA